MLNGCEAVWVVGAAPDDGEMQSHPFGQRAFVGSPVNHEFQSNS